MNMNKITFAILLGILSLTLFSCSDLVQEPAQKSDANTYLVVRSGDISVDARSVDPDIAAALDRMQSITLYGKMTKKADGTDYSGTRTSLKSASALKDLYNALIFLDGGAGEYTFELVGSIDSIYFYQKVEGVLMEESKTNTVSFSLSPVKSSSDYTELEDYGGIDIKLKVGSKNTTVNKTIITLENLGTGEVEDTIEKTCYSNPEVLEYKRWASYTSETSSDRRIPVGTYRVTFNFYWGTQCLNSIPYVVHVARGLNSILEQSIDLNEVYTITYKQQVGSYSSGLSDGQTVITKYSRKSENIVLPRYYRAYALFLGWFTEPEDGERITNIPHGSSGNITVYAHWQEFDRTTGVYVDLYVNPDATYHYGSSSEYGLSSLAEAVSVIKESSGNVRPNWTIKLHGTLTGAQVISNDVYSDATSVTIEGTSDLVNDIPQDGVDAGFTTATEDGTALSVTTTVPVTLKRLKITGGNNSGTGSVQGGGLYVADGAKVTLEEDVLITKNAAANGGGIYNEGTVIVSDAVISENTASGSGSGVYNNGTFKIGSGADIGSENDVYLPKEKTVTILEEGTMGSVKIMLTPSEYAAGTQIVVGENVTDLATEIKDTLFVTPQTKDDSGATLDAPVEWILDEDGKLQLLEETDFVLVEGGTIGKSENVGMEDNNADGNDLIIPDLLVGSHLVTQEEYEQLMTYYGVVHKDESLVPSADDDKAKTPAYFVSWIDAIIYCNLLSESEGLTPVYSMSGQNEITAASTDDNPNPWTKYYHVAEYDGKYYYDSNDLSYASSYDWDSDVFRYDFSADGYRLPTSAEYRYLLQNNPDVIGETGYNEWCNNYFYDYVRVWFDGENGDVAEGNDSKESITRESNLGFRVVRNATE